MATKRDEKSNWQAKEKLQIYANTKIKATKEAMNRTLSTEAVREREHENTQNEKFFLNIYKMINIEGKRSSQHTCS